MARHPIPPQKKNKKNYPPISVVICARNEANNLAHHIPLICQQQYAEKYEVIVVNDRSTDETLAVLEALSNSFTNLRYLSIQEEESLNFKGKKNALDRGILAAKYDYLLLTDADCQVVSDRWMHLMATHFISQKSSSAQMILGYGPYKTEPGFLNKIIQYETFQATTQYMSHALWGIPYMGTGRNLAYHKSLFVNNKGFEDIGHIVSGDDDLFVSKVATQAEVSIELDPASFCVSPAKTTYKEWISQKTRHLQTGFHYQLIHKLTLGLYSLTHFLFYFLLALLLWFQTGLVFALLLYAAKQVIQLVVMKRLGIKLQSPLNLTHFFILEKLFALYHLFFLIIILLTIKQPVLWKQHNLDSEGL